MGRWAQRHRRGGGGDSTPTPPPLPCLLTAFDDGSGLISLTFDSDVTADPGGVPNTAALLLDGTPVGVSAVTQISGTRIQVQQDVDPSVGSDASWASQPPWIVEAIDLSCAVVVSGV